MKSWTKLPTKYLYKQKNFCVKLSKTKLQPKKHLLNTKD